MRAWTSKSFHFSLKHFLCLFISCCFYQLTLNAQNYQIIGRNGFCPNETIRLDAGIGYTRYRWITPTDTQTSQTILVNQAGLYRVTVTNAQNDTLTASKTISAFPTPSITLIGTPYICPKRPTTVSVAERGYASYLWSTGIDNQQIMIESPTTVSVSVVDTNGCRNGGASITIRDGAPSFVPLPDSSKICEGDSVVLDATANDATFYHWDNQDTMPTQVVRSTGRYTVIVSNGQCVSYDTAFVQVLPRPVFRLPNDTLICQKDTVILRGAENELYEYRWHDGSTQPIYKAFRTGAYSLTVSFGRCTETDTFHLTIFNERQGLVLDSVICTPQYRLSPNLLGAIGYSWTDGSTAHFKDISKSGIYQVLATNGKCFADLKYRLRFLKRPNVYLGKDTVICVDIHPDYLLLKTNTEGAQLRWTTGDTTPSVWATKSGVYGVLAQNDCGAGFDDIQVRFDYCFASYIPNIFSPNGDGQNDVFRIFAAPQIIKIKRFQIFDRWGNLVYGAQDFLPKDAALFGWDGTIKGRLANPDVFIYFVEVEAEDGRTFRQKGDISLIR
jgi:gliding motility-associated-like protein